MWEIRIEDKRLMEVCSQQNHCPRQVTLTIRATYIRDGTPGVSLTLGGAILGEWTDSKVKSLSLSADGKIGVCGAKNNLLYKVVMPGSPVDGEQLSEKEVTVTVEI